MRLRDSDGERALRLELRAWLRAAVPTLPPEPPPDDWAARRARDTTWQRMLHDAGYAGITWPVEFGGRGAGAAEQLVFLEESQLAGAPHLGVNFVGLLHAGPTLFTEGTEEQRRFHLPPILRGEHVWCQGFSEPGAGSDLASLRTRAVRDRDHYVVTGQKIWTSWGHVADYCELLVRTDPDAPKHRGITWLILDMRSPGVEVRPLRTANGTTEFCELFLDEVRVPVANRVGAEHDGWRVSMVTFGFEHGGAVVTEMMRSRQLARDLAALLDQLPPTAGRASHDGLRRDLGHVLAELDGLWALARRQASTAERGAAGPFDGSVFKIAYADTLHRLSEVAVGLLGRAALTMDDLGLDRDLDRDLGLADGTGTVSTGRQVEHAIWALSVSISAGTTQIQRNIVAERILGLPQGAGVDFALSADQVALQDTVRAVCAKRFQSADVRRIGAGGGVEPASWADLVDLGVFDLRIPAERGGVGLGLADAVLVLEELGRHLVPGPVVASELAVAVAGLQPCLAALVERDASPLLVECLPALDVVLVMDADGLWSVAPSGLEAEPVARPLDPLAPLHRIRRLPRGDQLGGPELVARVRLEGATLTAAYLTGSAAAVTDLAVEHARIREQFDRPIGSFQAVKHLLADMVVRAAVAQAAVHAAGVTVDEAGDESGESLDDDRAAAWAVSRAVSTAKVLAGEAAVRNAKSALQVHGGMGYTWDVDVHLHLKRAWHLNTTFGTPDEHALRLVEQQPRS